MNVITSSKVNANGTLPENPFNYTKPITNLDARLNNFAHGITSKCLAWCLHWFLSTDFLITWYY